LFILWRGLSLAGIARDIGENLGIWRIYVSREDETVAAIQYLQKSGRWDKDIEKKIIIIIR
jgi:hypothetical protein